MNEYYRDENYRNYRNYRENYRDENYRDDEYDDDDYRSYRNYRDYRENNRSNRGGRSNRSNRDRYGRNYRTQDDFYGMLYELVEEGMELARAYEDAGEMTNNSKDKSTLMKIAEREKEHYRAVKEILEKGM